MTFTTSYDRLTKIVTPLALFVQVAALVTLFFIPKESSGNGIYTLIAFIFIILITSIAFAPRSYEISDGLLVINRMLAPPLKINILDIKLAEAISKEKVKGSIRTFGSGSFLGYYGKFVNKNYGVMTWYATRLDKPVLIRTDDGKKYILSPDDVDSFTATLQRQIKKAA